MANQAKAIFVGHLADAPTEIPTRNDNKMCSLRLVTNHFQGKDNPELVQSHNLVAYRHDADYLLQYAKKGDKLYAETNIKTIKKGEGDDATYFINYEIDEMDLTSKKDKE